MRLIWPAVLVFLFCGASAAQAQRVMECSFVSVDPASFTYGTWSFAADISGGYLHLLLVRPADATPYVTAYDPLRPGVSIHNDVSNGSESPTAQFEMATVAADHIIAIDQWSFGGSQSYDRLTLRCPSHE